jgi:uncharacterized membrane protein YgdD (TMEM256/DUF423 family)
MTPASRWILAVAGALIALATISGAFGAHALRGHLSPDRLAAYETAVRYHFFHALGLLAIGVTANFIDTTPIRSSAYLIIAGIILFSGSIYALSFGAPRFFGPITPLGGLFLIIGWVLFAISVFRAR